ncbi:MAG: UvrD-helicase domain-containing protein [Planctomycetia bacterium]|nr:UvrD-helicase domain-containing protein [Planctomycetia bacterium]
MSLNSAQEAAVETLSGPLLVLAGAGTGKTRVVTERVARLIRSGIKADRILAVTFTNKAAREMQQRISQRIGSLTTIKPEISTFHSLCVRILRRQIHHLGFPNQFSIYDRGDQESVARQILRDIRVAGGALTSSDFLNRVSRWKCAGRNAEQAMAHLEDARDYIAAVAYRKYQMQLKTLGAVDFDDILLHTEELFQQYPEVLDEEAQRFDHLLIDEYQDTNMSQYRIVKGLALKHRNICVVGDDDQAIYGWRGAEVSHILNFKNDWKDAKVIRLEMNYRSTIPILQWANRVIQFNLQRHPKRLKTDVQGASPQILQCKDGEAEAKTVVSLICERLKSPNRQPRDFAILFRTNEQPRAFEMELRAQNIPYSVVGGQSFFDRKEIKDILSYLRILVRPQDDISLLRVINSPPRGIGSTSIRRLTEMAIGQKKSTWSILKEIEQVSAETDSLFSNNNFATNTKNRSIPSSVSASSDGSLNFDSPQNNKLFDNRTQKSLGEFRQMIQAQGALLKKSFTPESLSAFIEAIDYRREIDRQYPDASERETRWNSVGEVINATASYLKEHPNGTLLDFLDNASLGDSDFAKGNEKKLDKNAILLMTYHAAKGLEFKEVFMVGMEEGILPHQRSLTEELENIYAVDEERRLCYVGITRAQRRLTLTLALNRFKWGKLRPTIPSRFLYEVTGQADNPRYKAIKNGSLH